MIRDDVWMASDDNRRLKINFIIFEKALTKVK